MVSRGRRRWRLLAFGLAGTALGGLAFILQAPPRGGPASTPATPAAGRAAAPGDAPAAASAALYRWRDSRGGIHLTSQPPPAGTPVDVIPIGGAVSPPPAAASERTLSEAARAPSPTAPANLAGRPLDVYTPQGFQELVERLGDTRRQMEERDRIFEQMQRDLRP